MRLRCVDSADKTVKESKADLHEGKYLKAETKQMSLGIQKKMTCTVHDP